MSSYWGDFIKLSVFGESHGPGIGVVIDDLPAGQGLDMEAVRAFMDRRGLKFFLVYIKTEQLEHLLRDSFEIAIRGLRIMKIYKPYLGQDTRI